MKHFLLFRAMLAWILFMFPGLFAAAHAAIPAQYNIDIPYQADQAVIPDILKADAKMRGQVVYVADFADARQGSDKKMLGQVREIGDARVPVFLKKESLSRIVTGGVKDYLKKAGYKVADQSVAWDGKAAPPKLKGKLLVSGSIDEMEVGCWTGVFSNDYKVKLKLSLVLADPSKNKILHKSSVSIEYSKTDVSFSEGQLGNQAGLALVEAINKLFEGKTTAQKIREALVP